MSNRRRLVDVLSFYGIIKNAYSHHTAEKAHELLERHLLRFGTKSNLVLYVDGGLALEKQETAKHRQESRNKAATKCSECQDKLEAIIDSEAKPRKQHFVEVKKNLASTFYWNSEIRQSFITYMEQAGWTIRRCETEADVALASDCLLEDIIISADSDLLAYDSVATIWRPISNFLILQYTLKDVRTTLGLTPAQLTALAVVSSNDYNRNIYSLGPATNYSILKSITESSKLKQKKRRTIMI